jgi:peptidyl-prolyl cis-trans isomerase C
MYKTKNMVVVGLMALTIFSFGFFGGGKSKDSIATVEKESISVEELTNRIASYPPQFQAQLQSKESKVKILDQMIDELVLFNEAKNAGYKKNAEYKKQLDLARKQILIGLIIKDKIDSKVDVNDAEIQAYFVKNKDQFAEIEQRKARHILVKTKAEANRVLRQLRKGASFSPLAKKMSIDKETAKNGGELGWFTKGRLVPEFEKAAYNLKIGQISKPIKTQFGYHVIKLDDMKVRPALKLDDIKPQIKQALATEKRRQLTDTLLTKLKKDQKISRDISKIN